MTTQELKNTIREFAKENNISFIAACKHLQGAAAKMNNEEMIMAIHKIKIASL